MRAVQLDLLGERDPLGLTERQRAAFDMLSNYRDGLTAQQVGSQLHFLRGRHASYATCNWCATDGAAVLVELRRKGLTVRRRSALWQLTRQALRELPYPPGTGPGELPEGF